MSFMPSCCRVPGKIPVNFILFDVHTLYLFIHAIFRLIPS